MRTWAIEQSDQGPVYLGYRVGHIRTDGRAFRAIVYNKGATVLHMLRRFVGDEAFFLGLQRFYVETRFDKASTEDFRHAMEAESGAALERFFESWIYQPELPHLKLTYQLDQKAARTAVIRVEQTTSVFDLPVTLTLQYVDQPNSSVIVKMTERVAELRVPLTGTLRGVELSRDDGTLAIVEK
jgi:aminopeptidase N